MAALCVVCAFCTLTFYDFFALRTIGKTHVPYRIAAMSSFTSYNHRPPISRHRLYRRGDPVPDLFRLRPDRDRSRQDLLSLRLTFWLGNLFVLGFGMAWHPWAASAMDLLRRR